MRLQKLLAILTAAAALLGAPLLALALEPSAPQSATEPAGQPENEPPDPKAPSGDEGESAERTGSDASLKKPQTPASDPARELREALLARIGKSIMSAPFGGGRSSFLHSLIGYPDMVAGAAAPPGCGRGWISGEMTRSSAPAESGTEIDGTYFETRAGFSFSLSEFVETHGSLSAAIFGGDASVSWMGAQVVPADRSESFRVSRASIGAMLDVFPLPKPFNGLWGAIDLKIPVTDQDLVDSGRPGVAFSLVTTSEIGPVFLHLNLGWFLSDSQQCFEPIATAYGEVRLAVERSMFWGLSLVWPVADFLTAGIQYTGNTNAFRDLQALDSDVHCLNLGLRLKYNTFYCELAGGAGLTASSADFGVRLEIGFIVDPALISLVTQTGKR